MPEETTEKAEGIAYMTTLSGTAVDLAGEKWKWNWKAATILTAVLLFLSIAANIYILYRYIDRRTYIKEIESEAALYSLNYYYFDTLTVGSFEKKVAAGDDFIVLISHTNCTHCEQMEKPFIRMATEMGVRDKVYHVNVMQVHGDEKVWNDFKAKYGLEGTPTYARYANGELVSSVGWTSENGINIEMVEEWFVGQSDFFDS